MRQGGELRAFNDDLPVLHGVGVRAVVSLLNLPGDELVYRTAGIDFLCLPIPDGGVPSVDQVKTFVDFTKAHHVEKRAVAVHCQAGLGRTGTMLATYLVATGQQPAAAIAKVRSVEPAAIETRRQLEFLLSHGTHWRP